jgi:hypothetical protein
MYHFSDQRIGKVLLGLFFAFALVLGTLVVFLVASRRDESWIGPQAEKAAREVPQRLKTQPGNK